MTAVISNWGHASKDHCFQTGTVSKHEPLGNATDGQLRDLDDELMETCSVDQLLAYKRCSVDAFRAAVGEKVLSQSVVGQQPLLDVWSLRFLIGFKWNAKLAAEKFTSMVKYRVQNGLDSIRIQMESGRLEPPEFPGYREHHEAYAHASFDVCSGSARGARPLAIECLGKFDWAALFAIDNNTADAYMMHVMEWSFMKLDQAFLKTGRLVGYVKIFDLSSCSMKQVQWVRKWNQANAERRQRLGVDINECYPEWFAKVIVVNAPSYFPGVWKVFRPFVPARTAEKVEVESSFACAKRKMLHFVDAAVLPRVLGGDFAGEWRMTASQASRA